MTTLKNKYPEEYIIYNLSSVAVAMVFPLVKKYLEVGSACYKLCVVCFSQHCVGLGCVGVTSLPSGGVRELERSSEGDKLSQHHAICRGVSVLINRDVL